MKRIASIVLALMLLASLTLTAFAAGETGSITITGAREGNVYEIYRVLDLKYSKDADQKEAYSYTVNTDWYGFFFDDEDNATDAQNYITIAEGGFASWNNAMSQSEANKAEFAKMALAYAKANGLTPLKSSKNTADFESLADGIKFSGLELGYYLVDSTMGTLCGLTTTNYDASINAKNSAPTINKQVKEDSTSQWVDDFNTADIGQEIEYRVTIDVHAGAENFVLHDTMVEGLTFGEVTGIEHIIPGTGTHVMDTAKYTVLTGEDVCEDCTFEVVFDQVEVCDKLKTNDKLVVSYTATLNDKAAINGNGNKNTAVLTFGETPDVGEEWHQSNEDFVFTKTFAADIVKTDSSDKLLLGAEFKIYDAAEGGNEVYVALHADGSYHRAAGATTGATIVLENGKIRVNGLDNGTYYLEETKAPEGYNRLTERQVFYINNGNLEATFNGDIYSTGSGVQVVNNTGTKLPETGGMGTTLFIVLGAVVVLGAGALLVTKKRMSKIAD